MTTPIEALIHLSRQEPTHDDFSAFQIEVRDETNNRGIAALLAANADLALRSAIDRNLLVREGHFQDLFSPRGILNSFEAKIRIGYHMGIYGDQHKQNLDCIRAIRNAFAHMPKPLNFDTPEVRAVCDLMTMPAPIAPHTINTQTGKPAFELVGGKTARQRYIKICSRVSHNRFWIGTTISPGIQCDPTNVHVRMKARHVRLP
jgi:hypothetical protein